MSATGKPQVTGCDLKEGGGGRKGEVKNRSKTEEQKNAHPCTLRNYSSPVPAPCGEIYKVQAIPKAPEVRLRASPPSPQHTPPKRRKGSLARGCHGSAGRRGGGLAKVPAGGGGERASERPAGWSCRRLCNSERARGSLDSAQVRWQLPHTSRPAPLLSTPTPAPASPLQVGAGNLQLPDLRALLFLRGDQTRARKSGVWVGSYLSSVFVLFTLGRR